MLYNRSKISEHSYKKGTVTINHFVTNFLALNLSFSPAQKVFFKSESVVEELQYEGKPKENFRDFAMDRKVKIFSQLEMVHYKHLSYVLPRPINYLEIQNRFTCFISP